MEYFIFKENIINRLLRYSFLLLSFPLIFLIITFCNLIPINALAHFPPTGGQIVVGTDNSILTYGTESNTGSWKGTLTYSNGLWSAITDGVNGLDQQIFIDNVKLNGANKLIITIGSTASTTYNRYFQICDWVSNSYVDNAADSNCTTGGWRTINLTKSYATNTTLNNIYNYHLYDGYFTSSTTSNTTVSTPISNFVSNDSNRRVLIRAYSSSTTSAVHNFDYVNLSAIIDPMYSASGFTQIAGGTVSTSYINTINGMLSYSGFDASDDVRLEVPGTASAISNFYLSHTNIETYTGMNTILVYSEYSCSTTGINIKPKIYNFNTSSWEDLTSTTIACSATDATNQFAKNNVTVSNYISSGEIRIGWYGSANSTVAIRIDVQYIILGTTNSDSSKCEISWGTGTATNCSNTRNIDTTATVSTWSLGTEKEAATFSHDFYAFDNDDDGKTDEAQLAANLSFSITPPSNGQIVYLGYSERIIGSTTMSAVMGFKNYSPAYNSKGGWNPFGIITTDTYQYRDMTTLSYFYPTTGANELIGYFGKNENPLNYFEQLTNTVNIRLRTEDCSSKSSTTAAIDFIMVTMSWTEEDDSILSLQSGFLPSSGQLVTGTETTINSNATSGTTGSWKGTLDEDEWGWVVNNNTSSGLNQQIRIDNVTANGANKMKIVLSANSNSASLNRVYQICDWVSSTNVDNAADTQCTTGGWRTLNIRKAVITGTALTSYTWHIYDGYWTTSTTSNTSVSTPLSNFITTDANKRVLIRAYSASTVTSTHTIDYIGINLIIDTTYFPAGFTQITGDTVSTSYINTINATLTGQSASDDTYLTVPGTAGAISDFYLSYKNVETYIGMNSLVLVSEYSCSTTGINHMPKIYNFSTSSWTDLISSAIACSGTDATSQFALNNVTISNYISSGEIRIGWYGSANSTVSLRQDMQYIILGTTNTDSSACDISFGTGTESNCVNTRTLDSTLASPSTWQPETEQEMTTLWYQSFSHDFYGGDFDHDTTLSEYAVSSNITFDLTLPGNAIGNSLNYSIRYRSNSSSLTLVPGIKDNSGQNQTVDGGWLRMNTTNASTSYTYADGINTGHDDAYFPYHTHDFIDVINNHINIRFSTSVSTASSTVTSDIDFAMVTFSWVEGTQPTTTLEAYRFYNNNNSTDVGTVLANQNTAATLTSSGQIFRVRTLIAVASASLPMDTEFKLQFAGKGAGSCASPSGTPSTYTDVTTSTAISYYDNSTPTDGTLLTGNTNDPTSSNTILDQTYEEANNFSNSINLIPVSNSGLWDFALYDHGAAGSTTYCLKIVYSTGTVLNTYSYYPELTTSSSSNSAPNSPTSLVQAKTDDTVISVGGWINQSSVKFSTTASDPNNPDTLYLCIEVDPIGTSFSNTEDTCGTGVSYSGTPLTVTHTILFLSEASNHWQARIKDTGGLYSSWVSYGGNLESERDFGIDTSAPTALSVYDGTGTGVDTMFNTGSLSILSANWGSLNADISGLEGYEYSIGTTAGDTSIKTWTDVNTDTSVTATSLTLQSSQMYYINIRVSDNATNTAVFSSNGQSVLPTLSFTLSSGSITFSNLNPSNSFTDTEITTLTTSTNAYWGYTIRLFKADSLRSVLYPTVTIPDFSGGSYASPDGWLVTDYGFGYTSSDTLVEGVNKFNPVTCAGGNPSPCYAPFSSTSPGDTVADHTATVSGSPVTNEQFNITYKVKTTDVQAAGSYTTTLIYSVIPQY